MFVCECLFDFVPFATFWGIYSGLDCRPNLLFVFPVNTRKQLMSTVAKNCRHFCHMKIYYCTLFVKQKKILFSFNVLISCVCVWVCYQSKVPADQLTDWLNLRYLHLKGEKLLLDCKNSFFWSRKNVDSSSAFKLKLKVVCHLII